MSPDLYPHKFEASIPLPHHIEKHGPKGSFKLGEKSAKASLNALRDLSATFVYLHGEDEKVQTWRARIPRYRKLYPDLVFTRIRGSASSFNARHHIVNYVRRFFDNLSFPEVEMPMISGRTTTKRFTTISTLAINRVFRSKGVDLTHDPELSICEFQMVYADCDITGSLAEGIATKDLTGGKTMPKFHPESRGSEKAFELSFRQPWARSRQ
ncbi:uncharacterized protein PHACADRAFT_201775 [Phanerochaete carnosa HHB-10118-sp]|uniref:Aminoacyl-transfer RNA synthetases class-II family profile domain-containing protein n=1 Tax=Phanerochaete carnosa (strain HHB-10118-sp) TaxID=650164 RepID=K5UIK4_PHACS|nr:uncharacterized protein PHACADRAFT_201775 [Phanerochaete carnosa HHB-10118-sp]EKM49331.1 hypothetical protein PHACADRAFT_201775 [Phanerochaete carnosa HHB-10118-sp]